MCLLSLKSDNVWRAIAGNDKSNPTHNGAYVWCVSLPQCVCNAHVVCVCVCICMCVMLTSASWQANTAYWKMIACFWAQQSDSQTECVRGGEGERGVGGFADYLFARTLMIYARTFHLLHIIRGKPATVPRPTHSLSPSSFPSPSAWGRRRGKLASFI